MINGEIISRIAFKALIMEVSAYPKPGLVDIVNSGSHTDMDYFTFVNSSVAISDYFRDAFNLGLKNYMKDDFDELRELGKDCEKKMYAATDGVNTHKGIIFSLGLLVYATGIEYRKNNLSTDSVIDRVKLLAKGVTKELDKNLDTAGGRQYTKYGLKGVREEAEEGFEKARDIGLYSLKKYLKTSSINDAVVNTLMHFMEVLEDSNLIKRGDLEGLIFAKESAKRAIELGLMNTDKGRRYIHSLNREFVKRNLSPGGSADYLILTLYLYFLEEL
jgi:triphosphoribosyl-dephospho-CoA synthase